MATKRTPRPRDPIALAKLIGDIATGQAADTMNDGKDEAAAVIAGALERGEGWLLPDEIARLFDCYGVPTALTFRAGTPEEAADMATHVGGPVVLKAVGPLHKTEVGAVRVGLAATEVAAEAAAMAERIKAHGEPLEGFVVQELVSGGVEMLVGMTADPEFGPVVACGAGGKLRQ